MYNSQCLYIHLFCFFNFQRLCVFSQSAFQSYFEQCSMNTKFKNCSAVPETKLYVATLVARAKIMICGDVMLPFLSRWSTPHLQTHSLAKSTKVPTTMNSGHLNICFGAKVRLPGSNLFPTNSKPVPPNICTSSPPPAFAILMHLSQQWS